MMEGRGLVLGAALMAVTLVVRCYAHADTLYVESTGIGINDPSPSFDLDVTGSFRVTAGLFADSSVTVGDDLEVSDQTELSGTLDVTGEATFDDVVGVGTSAPEEKLHVVGVTLVDSRSVTGGERATQIMRHNGYDASGGYLESEIVFQGETGTANEFREVAAIREVQYGGGSTHGGQIEFHTRDNGTGKDSERRMFIDGDGEVYFETYPSCTTLGTNGSGKLTCTTSSVRFKENISDYDGGLDVVMGLNAVSYDFIREWDSEMSKWQSPYPEGRQIGFLAEEVEQVEPLVTGRNRDGLVNNVNYQLLTVVLVNAIQQQQAQIEELQQLLGQ